MKTPEVNSVFVFIGPPGVGKTEMAQYFSRILFENNLLPGKRFLSINAAQMKAGYVGQTAAKISALFLSYDAILIDECYSLSATNHGQMDTFSQEALAQICVELEKHAKTKLIIFAGYGGDVSSENNKMLQFLNANPGIASRVTFHINFPTYSPDFEMPEIFHRMAENSDYDLEEGWRELMISFFTKRAKAESFGNAREARKAFQVAIKAQASRLAEGPYDLKSIRLITCGDLIAATSSILESESRLYGKERRKFGFSM